MKRSFSPVDEAELRLAAHFQDAARSTGVAAPRIMRPQHFSMAIAQLGYIRTLSCRSRLAAQSPAERTLNEGRVAEVITKPPVSSTVRRHPGGRSVVIAQWSSGATDASRDRGPTCATRLGTT